ncbi:calcium-dependent phosphotriesterase [Aspergillus affinis]|uniref:calcium-dependent phosphotriesterase n=1 Tax=Aspergillus affinis TaxID=1070780 RepID=UPI0022FDE5BE|nr:calcium-dependent phosphotriesterase [Aspergillus affinis]KAI9034805.1 calcium-dependent phosphotriesterase [Aspergillus affinis]
MAPSIPSQRTSSYRRLFIPTIIFTIASLYKIYLHNLLILSLSIGRAVQSIEEFPFKCEKIEHPFLSTCEDIWLDGSGRKLYAACGEMQGRKGWCPGGGKLNASARTGSNWISVLDIDRPGVDGLYGLRKLKVGDSYTGDLDLNGFDVQEIANGVLRFWLINHRPPVDAATGELLDASKVGANSTIEVFDLGKSSEILEHVKTIVSDAIITPNNLVVEEDGDAFLVTNDRSRKFGFLRDLEILVGGGNVARCCTGSGDCQIVAKQGFHGPNGITRGQDGLFYVVQSFAGKVSIHELVDGQFNWIDEVDTGFLMDNLSVDSEGNIFVAAFPEMMGVMRSFNHPGILNVAATVLQIKRTGEVGGKAQYEVEKMLEDKDGKMLSTSTTAAYDVQTKRLFIGGIMAPHVTICKQRA